MSNAHALVRSPVGWLRVEASPQGLTAIRFMSGNPTGERVANAEGVARDVVQTAVAQLDAYFSRRLTRFDVPLDLRGTRFQIAVWEALTGVPWGTTVSYGELARRIGRPGAARAVGGANGANPIPIVIPCHRVITSRGLPGGYSAGIERKRALLAIEGVSLASAP